VEIRLKEVDVWYSNPQIYTRNYNRNMNDLSSILVVSLRVLKPWPLLLLVFSISVFVPQFVRGDLNFPPQVLTNPVSSSKSVYQVSLDAYNVGQTDVNVISSASQDKSFRIGAVINSSSTSPLTGVYAWQFAISYNASAFTAQGDPSSAPYPDGASSMVMFGAQISAGTINWAGLIATGQGFGGSKICNQIPNIYDCVPGKIYVYFTLLAAPSGVSILANTLLASVNFESLTRPSTPQSFSVTEVKFVNSNGVKISGLLAGASMVESALNAPPHAIFKASPNPSVGPFAFTFDATASFDPDGMIPDPNGYFWDFGDGTQDLGVTGRVVTHDYGVNDTFLATLRVQDDLGSTGASRDPLGAVLFDEQPSHARIVTGSRPDAPPIAFFTFNPLDPGDGQNVYFDGRASYDLDGSIRSWLWYYGDGSQSSGSPLDFAPYPQTHHFYRLPGNYTVSLTVTDYNGISTNATMVVPVHARPLDDLAMVALSAWPSVIFVSQTVDIGPRVIVSSQSLIISFGVINYGVNNETADVTAFYGSNVIGTIRGAFFPATNIPCDDCSNTQYLSMEWDTTGIAPGNYTISATVFLATDHTPSDNTEIGGYGGTGEVQVLPLPASTITITPSKGPAGNTILVQGSDFPRNFYNVKITYDSQLVGFAKAGPGNGRFNFTFTVPPSYTGPHMIEAQDQTSAAYGQMVFHVLPLQMNSPNDPNRSHCSAGDGHDRYSCLRESQQTVGQPLQYASTIWPNPVTAVLATTDLTAGTFQTMSKSSPKKITTGK